METGEETSDELNSMVLSFIRSCEEALKFKIPIDSEEIVCTEETVDEEDLYELMKNYGEAVDYFDNQFLFNQEYAEELMENYGTVSLVEAVDYFDNQILFTQEDMEELMKNHEIVSLVEAVDDFHNQILFTQEDEEETLLVQLVKDLEREDIEFWNRYSGGLKKSVVGKYWVELQKLLLPTLQTEESLGELKLSRCYSAGYITSKDFATRCMVRKRKELIKERLSTVSIKELEDSVNNIKDRMVDNPSNQTSLPTLTAKAKSLSRNSDRNRKKRLKKKLKNKAKREELDNNLSRSNSCLLYMFASMHSGGYLLYRIDALEHACKYNENNELLPLLVFGPDILPVGFCTLVHMGHYIYFVGEKPCDVFKIRKDDLKNLFPGEDNLGLEYLIPIKQPMQGPKRTPLVFVANDDLYVISQDYSCESHEFEKYSPADDSWRDMNPKPKGHGPLKSHVVLDNVAYFATADETVLSCNLTDGSWSIVSSAPKYPRTFCDIHPAFDAPILIVGNMILGAFKLPSDFNITVAASPHSHCHESVKNSFMRPTLAPDSKFWSEFARRFDYIRNNESHGSHYMTALQTLDGENILCFVSYGNNPSIDEPHRSYALLTFYKILGDHWKTSVRLKEEVLEGGDTFCYYSRQVEAGNAIKSYFKSEFMQRKLFNITTPKLHSTGKLITCLAY